MRALVWIVEDTWQATVAEAAAYLPAGADITLLHVSAAEAEGAARAARHALLGRPHPPVRGDAEPLRAISKRAADELLADAQARLGRPARCETRRGRLEREVGALRSEIDGLKRAGTPVRIPEAVDPPERLRLRPPAR